ncbi:MAG: chemotaxis protein CheC [Nitrospirae bacterium]|nr:chemotaxis protein CheC [Nitrospirota bacterium]
MSVKTVTKERIEFMEDRLSIAADKAAHALSQMLKCRVDVNMSSLHITDLPGLPGIVEDPKTQVVGVRMNMFGDLKGEVFFLIYEKDKDSLMQQINDATFGEGAGVGLDISILEEVGNIVAGVYLTTIYEIARLNVYHSIPSVAMDMFSSLIDESIAEESMASPQIVMIENLFTVTKESIKTFLLLLIPSSNYVNVFLDAVERAENR